MLKFLDLFFLSFHSALILFNLFGWVHPRLRPWHLASLLITAGSWFIMGIWYGWGYCICTDLHWDVLHELGHQDLPNSYIVHLGERLFGIRLSSFQGDALAVSGLFVPLILNLFLFFRERRKEREKG